MKECHDLVRAAVSNLTALLTNQDLVVATPLNIAEETSSSATSAARISHDVGAMKHLLYGIPEAPPDRVKAAELATEILRSELLEVLIVQLASLRITLTQGNVKLRASHQRFGSAVVVLGRLVR